MKSLFREILAAAIRSFKAKPPRSIQAFVEAEIRIPDGNYRGQRYRIDRQPVLRLWFDAIDSGDFNELVFTAPSQFGKTFAAFVIPLLYHTCELDETYILGVPYSDMAANKWEADVLPVLNASPSLRAMLPRHGSGSSGGKVRDSVTFAHGVICKFMSAGGQDAAKAGFTSRVFGVTEAKAFSEIREQSDEADPLRQLNARQRSYPANQRRSYVEGTLGTPQQLPHTLAALSTRSRILSTCPHCRAGISPERDDLLGWQDAKNEIEASANAAFFCPDCGGKIDEAQRRECLLNAKLVHDGQRLTKSGKVVGDPPRSKRLYFRASAWHNMFLPAGDIAADEWKAAQLPADSPEGLSAERELCQFIWCIPWSPPKLDSDIQLDKATIGNRRLELPRGMVPADTLRISVGVDLGGKVGWYVVLATLADGITRHIPDYDAFDIPSHAMPIGQAIETALEDLRKQLLVGFRDPSGRIWTPGERWYDAGYQTTAVLNFVRKHAQGDPNAADVAAYGRGTTMVERGTYTLPKKRSNTIRQIDPDRFWFMERELGKQDNKLYWDADNTKYQVLQSLTIPADTAGTITLYSGVAKIHDRLVRHLTNEPLVTEVNAFGAETQKFKRKGANHLLDALANAWRADARLAWRIEQFGDRINSLRPGGTDGEWYAKEADNTDVATPAIAAAGEWYES